MKTVFLDIDGTLVADKGIVPESAIQAIKIAQKNGHKIFLCTGRAMPEIYPFILDIGFDGIAPYKRIPVSVSFYLCSIGI